MTTVGTIKRSAGLSSRSLPHSLCTRLVHKTKLNSHFWLSCLILLHLSQLHSAPIEHLRLVWIESPQTEATVVWDSSEKTEQDQVSIWEKGTEGEQRQVLTFPATAAKTYTELKKKEDYYFRHVKLKQLKPSTTYELKASSDGDESRVFSFTTAPEDQRPFKLLYVGDSRTRVKVARKISGQLANMAHEDPEIIAALHGGDYANKPVLKDWKPWLNAWDQTTHPETGKLLPIIPVVGNHEQMKKSPLFGQAYGYPGGKNRYLYSCRLAPHCRIVVLNSEIPSSGEQEEFLKSTLEHYQREKVTFQIAAFHRPVYPAIKKPGVLKRLVPTFEEYGVDLVLESDGHCIKRTVPIKDGKQDPTGVVYLGEGGYGAPQRDPKKLWYLKEPGFASKGDHTMILKVEPSSIHYETVAVNGSIIDQHTFAARDR